MKPAELLRQLQEAAAIHQRGDLPSAEKLYRAILKKVPQQADALHLLGVLLDQRGDRAQGIVLVRRAIAAQGSNPDAHFNLARMLSAEGAFAEAETAYQKALVLRPGHGRAFNGLGALYRARGDYAAAFIAFEKAIRFEPGLTEVYINLCNAYRDTCQEENILRVADQGLAVDPKCAPLWLLRSEAAFTVGRLAEGWRDYDWRFRTPQQPVVPQNYPLPLWQGEDLSSKSVLLWGEQGVGDEIIFASLVKGIAAMAKRCVLQTTPRLVPLFRRSFPTVEVFGDVVPADIVKTLDAQCPLATAGRWRRSSFASFPAVGSYLSADPAQTALFRQRYKGQKDNFIVGLAWRSAHVTDATEKSVDLGQWGAILNVPGVAFVNLQYGDHRDFLAEVRREFSVDIIDDPSVNALADLDAFAAQTAAMDLVISSSNTAAHMAGALGVPTFCMIPRAMGAGRRWYWFRDGGYSPWYRSMTLFRQGQPGSWTNVLTDISLALVDVATAMGHMPRANEYLERLVRGFSSAQMQAEADKVRAHALCYDPTPTLLRDVAKAKLKDGDITGALSAIERAIQDDPAPADLHNTLGMILAKGNRLADAVAAYDAAIGRSPQAEFYSNRGTALRRQGKYAEALRSYTEAHERNSAHSSIALNYAVALSENEHFDDAIRELSALIAREPNYVDAHYNLSIALLSTGRLTEGWREFKWRLLRTKVHVRHEDFPQPIWNGEDLSDKHVIVWTELGLGEEILVASIVPDLVAVTRCVTLLCSERLVGLFRSSFPNVIVDVRAAPLPAAAVSGDIDAQMSLAELGLALRPSFGSFPTRTRFLKTDPALTAKLRQKYLGGEKNRLVGISWRSINPEIGAQKSIVLADWLPLLKIPGVIFVNLQYGDTHEERDALQREHSVELLHDPDINPLGDMRAVAEQIAAMDEVISISNTTVHMAGALGIPTKALLPGGQARLWYWFAAADRCLWYPSVQLLKAPHDEGWSTLMARCAAELTSEIADG